MMNILSYYEIENTKYLIPKLIHKIKCFTIELLKLKNKSYEKFFDRH